MQWLVLGQTFAAISVTGKPFGVWQPGFRRFLRTIVSALLGRNELSVMRHPNVTDLVCPICKGELDQRDGAYFCALDQRTYPILLGIPDFRVFPFLSIDSDQDGAKAKRLMAKYPERTYAELLKYYYSISPGTPSKLAEKYMAHASSGVVRGQDALAEVRPHITSLPHDTFLDIGCGTP